MSTTRCPNGRAFCHLWLLIGAATLGEVAIGAPDVVSPPIEVQTEPPSVVPIAGGRLRQVLEDPVAGLTWRGVPLGDALRDASEAFSVAIVRDRRIDPTRRVDVETAGEPLRNVFAEAAGQAGAEVRVVGNVVYIGPPAAAAVARTLAELRRGELEGMRDRRLAGRRADLLRGKSVGWGDLTEPVEALRLVTARFGLKVENAQFLPHDLWPGAVLGEVSAAEALTLVLIPFDLTFSWSDDLESVRIVPILERSEIVIERSYAAREDAEATAREWGERFPGLDARAEGGKVLVRGTVELHEEVEQTVPKTRNPRRSSEPKSPRGLPLERRRFTLAVAGVPATAVMAKLEESGITFEYEEAAFEAAGIDLNAPVAIDVKQADATAFFEALFAPIGVGFELAGNTVHLRVSAAKPGPPGLAE